MWCFVYGSLVGCLSGVVFMYGVLVWCLSLVCVCFTWCVSMVRSYGAFVRCFTILF